MFLDELSSGSTLLGRGPVAHGPWRLGAEAPRLIIIEDMEAGTKADEDEWSMVLGPHRGPTPDAMSWCLKPRYVPIVLLTQSDHQARCGPPQTLDLFDRRQG